MDALKQDLRFGLRLFRRSPGLTLAAVLSMALGIGANTMTFSLVHAMLLRPLPFVDAERLIILSARSPAGDNVDARVSYRDFQDLRRRSTSFSAMGSFLIGFGLTLTEEGPPFRTLGIPLTAGRDLTPDEATAPSGVAVVNQTLARLLWPAGGAESALGESFRFCDSAQPLQLTVVGVSPDLKDTAFREEVVPPTLYVSMAYHSGRPAAFLLRTHLPDEEILAAARRTIRGADPGLPIFLVHNLARRRDEQLAFDRLFGEGFALFGGSALLLAAIGVYGVLAYGVRRRLREIGIRVALGAGRGSVLWLVAGQGILLTLGGASLGLLAAFLAARSVEGLLYGVSPTDTASFLGMAILLVDVAFIACYLPARRALEVEPVEILRGE